MKKGTFSLTGNEWLVMEELWKGSATLMELVHALAKEPGWAKSTTATMVRRMEEKGLICHQEGGKAKRFFANISREEAGAAETRALLDKAFDGSVGRMVNTLVKQEQLSREEIDALYDILRQAEMEQDC